MIEMTKMYFVIVWVAIALIFFFVYLYFTDNTSKITMGNGSGYIFSSSSILGGINLICNRFADDLSKDAPFSIENFYIYYGGGMVIWVSIIGIKSKLKKEKNIDL